MTDLPVSLRPARPEDEAFLFQVYASTRAEEMALVDWTREQLGAFLRMQFDMQRRSYLMQSPAATYEVVVRDEVPVGRLIVERAEECIQLIDIALLPEYRGAGIGSTLIRDLQAEAARNGKVVRLHVEVSNPALSLYERLGFVRLNSDGLYWSMEWTPTAS